MNLVNLWIAFSVLRSPSLCFIVAFRGSIYRVIVFSWTAWLMSVAAVVVCGGVAWIEGNWRRREGLDLGFVDHGGMWGDLLLLPIANAIIVPHIVPGRRLLLPLAVSALVSLWLHARWHGGHASGVRDHMWPSRPYGHRFRDLSAAGWMHIIYVIGQFGLIVAWALTPMPAAAVVLVTAVLTAHVPLGLLQPGWVATGHRPTSATPVLVGALALLWVVAALKLL